MNDKPLRLDGDLQIEAAVYALEAAGAHHAAIYPLVGHLLSGSASLQTGIEGQRVINTASFTGDSGLSLRHMIMRGIESQLRHPNESRTRKTAAAALKSVLSRQTQANL